MSTAKTLRFGPSRRYTLDLAARTLHAAGEPVPLGARAFDVLAALADAGGELVTKERLLRQGWPGLVVEESNLHVQVSQLRKLLGATAIATVPSIGYRLAWDVRPAAGTDGGAAAHNLPAARTGFVGRDALLETARQRLAEGRLLTLIGIGGAGKTRLALRLAERLREAYADGAWWVDLAPLEQPEQLPLALAQAFQVVPQAGRDTTDGVIEALRGQQLLLVLDNCEHLVEAAAELADALLAALPGLSLLATSREALALPGESVLPVSPLALPPAGAGDEAIAAAEAVRLFAERAAMAAPWFALAPGDLDTVAQICRRVDGIPLAIELAAAQLRVVSPPQLLDLLQQRFRLLADPRRALPRQQTMQAVIAWSFDHLRPDEQRLLMALAMCSGGCDLDAAAALVGPDVSQAELLAGLARLAEQSLLGVQHGAPQARYQLLETVRQFALERLQGQPLAARLRERHVAHYLALAEAHEAEVARHGQAAATLAQMDRERDNLLRAIDACERDDDPASATLGLRFAGALRNYWMARALVPLGLRLTMAALQRARALPPDLPRLFALVSAAQLQRWSGQHEQALALARELAEAARQLALRAHVASAHGLVGLALERLGRDDEAAAEFEAMRRLAEQLGDDKLLGDALGHLAILASKQKRFTDGMAHLEPLLAIRRASGHGYRIALALLNIGYTATELGDVPRARAALAEAAAMLPRIDSMVLDLYLLEIAAQLAAQLADWPLFVRLRAGASRQPEGAMPPADAGEAQAFAAWLASAGEALGDAAFGAAWQEGLALEHPQRLAQVAAWLQRPPAGVTAAPGPVAA